MKDPILGIIGGGQLGSLLSVAAKRIGIKMGEPYFKVKELVKRNNVQIFSSNYALYGDISRRVMKVLKGFSDKLKSIL